MDKELKNNNDGGDSKPRLDPEEGTARRRDAAIKRMLETPPRQHQEDVGKQRKPHRKLVRGMKAIRGTAETDADPRNPNVVTESDLADCKADST